MLSRFTELAVNFETLNSTSFGLSIQFWNKTSTSDGGKNESRAEDNSTAVLKKVRYALCPMPNALCPMPYALEYLIFLRKAIHSSLLINHRKGDEFLLL